MVAEVQTDFDNEEDARVTLIVHNLKPPFLDGRVSFSMQQSTVATVRDPTSDFAQNARKGSALMREVREKKEMMKMRKRFWELGGSRMGDAMGIARPVEEEEKGVGARAVGGQVRVRECGRYTQDGTNICESLSFPFSLRARAAAAARRRTWTTRRTPPSRST